MIAGLLFATHDAEDRPDTLTATLPFAGVTLIEYQARMLMEAGAAQIVVVVSRLTPELLGAITRIGRRGIAIDPVRSAGEAAERLHPLARVLLLADGLVTGGAALTLLDREEGDTLLVVDEADATAGFERVGGGLAWAGAARLDAERIIEVAGQPRDYDFEATLIRVAAQAGARAVVLPSAMLCGHAIERGAVGLDRRGHAALAARVADRRGWFDRFVAAPAMRLVLPVLVARRVPGVSIGVAAAIVGAGGVALTGFGFARTGLILTLVASIAAALGGLIGELRDEGGARACRIGAAVLPAFAALVLGLHASAVSGDGGARVTALALVLFGAIAERAIRPRHRWLVWGSPGGYLLVVALFTLVGWPAIGLGVAALYAAATLAGAIEELRATALGPL